MNASLVFTVFAVVYLWIALSIVPLPIAAGFFTLCFGLSLIKAIHALVESSNGTAVKV